MHTYTIDTNAGPILRRDFSTLEDAKTYAVEGCPLTRRRGYTVTWEEVTGGWHVARVHNSKGRIVHRLALRQDRPTLPSACHR